MFDFMSVNVDDSSIYVAAINCRSNFYFVLGTLMHELSHLDDDDNGYKPYRNNQDDREKEFDSIVTISQNNFTFPANPIIWTVFEQWSSIFGSRSQ